MDTNEGLIIELLILFVFGRHEKAECIIKSLLLTLD